MPIRTTKIRKDLNLIEGAVIRMNGTTVLGAQGAAPAPLTDNSGGAASGTLAAISAGAAYSQADAVAIKNALASITATQTALINALKAAGVIA